MASTILPSLALLVAGVPSTSKHNMQLDADLNKMNEILGSEINVLISQFLRLYNSMLILYKARRSMGAFSTRKQNEALNLAREKHRILVLSSKSLIDLNQSVFAFYSKYWNVEYVLPLMNPEIESKKSSVNDHMRNVLVFAEIIKSVLDADFETFKMIKEMEKIF